MINYAQLAEVMYTAYGDAANWQAYNGEPMPVWPDLPEHIRIKWTAAAVAATNHLAQLVANKAILDATAQQKFIATLLAAKAPAKTPPVKSRSPRGRR